MMTATRSFYGRLIGSMGLFAVGSWFVVTQQATFRLGGRVNPTVESQRGAAVDASGLDAVAIGCAVIGIGIINLALGIRGRRRISVFWLGAALVAVPMLYGLGRLMLGVYHDVRQF